MARVCHVLSADEWPGSDSTEESGSAAVGLFTGRICGAEYSPTAELCFIFKLDSTIPKRNDLRCLILQHL